MSSGPRNRTKERAKLVRQVLSDRGPMGTTRLAQLTHLSPSVLRHVVDCMEQEQQVKVHSTGAGRGHNRTIRLPHQSPMEGAQLGSARFRHKARNKLGVEVSEELVKRALEKFKQGYQPGTFGLSQLLGISHAEAIACIGELFQSGKIQTYGQSYRLAVDRHEAAKRRLRDREAA